MFVNSNCVLLILKHGGINVVFNSSIHCKHGLGVFTVFLFSLSERVQMGFFQPNCLKRIVPTQDLKQMGFSIQSH